VSAKLYYFPNKDKHALMMFLHFSAIFKVNITD